MVFHNNIASRTQRITHQDNPWDTASIGSTFSSDFDQIRPKIDLKQTFTDRHNEWQVVPSGGAKARTEHINKQPHPCRYDEYGVYSTQDRTEERNTPEKPTKTKQKQQSNDEATDNNEGEGNTTSDKETRNVENNRDTGMNEGDTEDVGETNNTDKDAKNNKEDNQKEDGDDKEKEKETNEAIASGPGHDANVLQTFTLEFDIRSTPANTVGSIHKEFIKEIMTVAPFTTFAASNTRTTPAPIRITTIEDFPQHHLLHQKFFHRVDIRDKVKYTHHVYSPVSVLDIKRRALPFLQEHNLGMWNDEISNNSKVRVCWILNAHSRVTYKPKMKDKLCNGINQQQANYGDNNHRLLNQLPTRMHDIDLYTKTVTHQGHQTEAICVMAYKPAAPVIRELVGMLDHAYLGNGTSIVSDAAVRELDGDKYSQIIEENTAFHQNTRTISVKYFHELYWNHKYRPCEAANYTTVREWVLTGSGVVSIEPTKDTESEGRYIILCKSEGFPAFKRILQVMCQTLAKTIEENDEFRVLALEKYQQYPTIIGPHKIGKYAEQNAKGLLSRIDAPTVPKPARKRISTKIEFDFGSAEGFPAIQSSILNRRPTVRKSQKQQSWAAVAAPPSTDNTATSVASEPSEAGKSTQSVRTGITNTDQQTMQSEAMSVLTEFISQARTEDAERRKEEKEERKIEREERKAEAAARQRNEEARQRNEERRDENNRIMFQSMMALMTQNATGHAPAAQAFTIDSATTETTDEAHIQENLKKKRKNEISQQVTQATQPSGQTEQKQDEMEVEINSQVPTQQNHDPIQETQDPLLR